MKATFYIIQQSFQLNDKSMPDVIKSIAAFLSEYSTIESFCIDNEIIVDENVYNAVLPSGMTLGQYAYDLTNTTGEERDLKSALQRIFQRHNQKISLEQIQNLIASDSIENCYGIISIVPISGIANNSQIVYDKESWYDFRRYHLGLFYGNAAYFIEECKKYYPRMFFHDHNKSSIGQIFKTFSNTIINHLNGIHDILPSIIKEHPEYNQSQLLTELSTRARFPEEASVQGGMNPNLKFSFKTTDGTSEKEVLCELHAKLCYDDSNDLKYHKDVRIYFHKGRPDIENGKILIGHIGKHL